MPLSPSQLERHLLGAAEVLRGPLSPHQYQDYLLPLVFLKHASDVPRPHALIAQKGGQPCPPCSPNLCSKSTESEPWSSPPRPERTSPPMFGAPMNSANWASCLA